MTGINPEVSTAADVVMHKLQLLVNDMSKLESYVSHIFDYIACCDQIHSLNAFLEKRRIRDVEHNPTLVKFPNFKEAGGE